MAADSDLNFEIAQLLPEIRLALNVPTLQIQVSAEFAAAGTASRMKIRDAIIDALKPDEVEAQTLRMLEHVPNPPHASVSISHTPSVGGFAYTLSPAPSLGFDLEDIGRVHERAVARIAKPSELLEAPSAIHIWVAKEASFKALRGRPKVISSLTSSQWRSVISRENLSLWSCDVSEDSAPNAICRGLTVELSNTAFGIFVSPA